MRKMKKDNANVDAYTVNEFKQLVIEYADKNDLNKSQVVRQALREFFERVTNAKV